MIFRKLFLFFLICVAGIVKVPGQSPKVDSLKNILSSIISDSVKVHVYLNLANAVSKNDNTVAENEQIYVQKALSIAEKINYNRGIALSYDRLGVIERNKSNYSNALDYHNKALEYISPYGICREKAIILNNIGVVYRRMDELSKATDFHLRALKIAEEISDNRSITVATNSLGNIFLTQKNYDEAINYFEKALGNEKKINNLLGVAINLNNIGAVYEGQKDYKKAIEYYTESLKTNEHINSLRGISICSNSIGEVYKTIKNYPKALEMFQKAVSIDEKLGDNSYTSWGYINMGDVLRLMNQKAQAEDYLIKGITLAQIIGAKNNVKSGYEYLSNLYLSQSKWQEALDAYKTAVTYKDSILNEEENNAVVRLKAVYESEKQEKEIQKQKLEIALKDKAILKQKSLKIIFIGGFLGALLLSLLIFYNYRLKQKANEALVRYNRDMDEKNQILMMQKEEILTQRDQIEEKSKVVNKAYELIKTKNKNIIENIRYAFNIQNALLPQLKQIREYFPESFVMYKPRDIVSGDFYWMYPMGSRILVAAGDCTGHGVSGAFMSILGISSLNEIVVEKGITKPDQILNHLREKIIWSMQQEDKFWEARDGIDMSICSFDLEKRKVTFSGANSSVIYIRNNELFQIKGDKMPVSIFPDIIPFTSTEFDLLEGDTFYLFSDGFYHQFGGLYGKKFNINQFRELLVKFHNYDANTQLNKLEETYRKWRGRNEQVDDILILGFKISEDIMTSV